MHPFRAGDRNAEQRLDILHIILGIVIFVMAVMAFLRPEENMVLFPLIFFTAAFMRIITSIHTFRIADHDRKVNLQAILQLVFGLLLTATGIVSAISIWT